MPVIPVALRTDAWGTADVPRISDPSIPQRRSTSLSAHPRAVADRGTGEHRAIIAFITAKLREWGADVRAGIGTGG
ncbi:MAG: hypothetical protein MZV70_01160 [Desulfobacterales bacterium]|nr:hypothetical protein [Desulfobacterales bacterium]